VRNSKQYAEHFAKHIETLRRDYTIPTPQKLNPIEQLVSGFLMWEANSKRADRAYPKLLKSVVDFNELRVCTPHETVETIGKSYPLALERSQRLRQTLNSIYQREHDVQLDQLHNLPPRKARAYLNELEGMVPYVSAQIILFSFNAPAFPVDEQLRTALVEKKIIHHQINIVQLQRWIERQLPHDQMPETHLLLQGWVENQ